MALLFDNLPDGFVYRPDFITPEEEAALVRDIEAMEFSDVRMRGVTARRRVRQFGWRYSFECSVTVNGGEQTRHIERCQPRASRRGRALRAPHR